MPDSLVLLFVAALGLAVGSFLNVCIYRLPRGESLLMPASHCTTCGRSLAWYENVPVVSWLALRGRCRTCGTRISVMYPLVEAAAAVIAVTWYLYYVASRQVPDPQDWYLFVSRLVFALAMLVLFVIDLQHRILPNMITVAGIGVGFLLSLAGPPGWRDSLIGLLAGGGSLWLLSEGWYRLRGEEGMGMGDVKMMAMIGAFLGWKLMILTVILGSFGGSLIGLALIAIGKGDRKTQLPFGTFLALAAVAACRFGDPVVDWYSTFYR